MATTTAEEGIIMEHGPVSDQPVAAVDEVGSESSAGYNDKATRRLLRKIDFALIPFLALLYLWVFHSRSAIVTVRGGGLSTRRRTYANR